MTPSHPPVPDPSQAAQDEPSRCWWQKSANRFFVLVNGAEVLPRLAYVSDPDAVPADAVELRPGIQASFYPDLDEDELELIDEIAASIDWPSRYGIGPHTQRAITRQIVGAWEQRRYGPPPTDDQRVALSCELEDAWRKSFSRSDRFDVLADAVIAAGWRPVASPGPGEERCHRCGLLAYSDAPGAAFEMVEGKRCDWVCGPAPAAPPDTGATTEPAPPASLITEPISDDTADVLRIATSSVWEAARAEFDDEDPDDHDHNCLLHGCEMPPPIPSGPKEPALHNRLVVWLREHKFVDPDDDTIPMWTRTEETDRLGWDMPVWRNVGTLAAALIESGWISASRPSPNTATEPSAERYVAQRRTERAWTVIDTQDKGYHVYSTAGGEEGTAEQRARAYADKLNAAAAKPQPLVKALEGLVELVEEHLEDRNQVSIGDWTIRLTWAKNALRDLAGTAGTETDDV